MCMFLPTDNIPFTRRRIREMDIFFCVFVTSTVLGFIFMGLTTTTCHGAVHVGMLRLSTAPVVTLGLYGWPHLQHHVDIPNAVKLEEEISPSLLQYAASGKLWNNLSWVVKNLWEHQRWTPMRLLMVERAMLCFVVGSMVVSVDFGFVSGLGMFLGNILGLFAYDLWHLWTHVNGPYRSSGHAYHHGKQHRDFGMWFWNNIQITRNHVLLRIMLCELNLCESFVQKIMPDHWKQWDEQSKKEEDMFKVRCKGGAKN